MKSPAPLELAAGTPDDDRALMPPVTCIKCGYDLRGTYRDGRCPECGTPATRSVHQKPSRLARLKMHFTTRRLMGGAAVLFSLAVVAFHVNVSETWFCQDCLVIET